MHQKFQLFFWFGILLIGFCGANLLHAQEPSKGHVSFSTSWLESNPACGDCYVGTRKLLLPSANSKDKRKRISTEKWERTRDGQQEKIEPPEIITYKLVSRVTGQGAIHMSISGGTTRSFDVGTFRPKDTKPTRLTVERDIERIRVEKYKKLRKYLGGDSYQPSEYDTCIPVKDKGYSTEIKKGSENLSASGEVTSSYIKVVYGTEKQINKTFGFSGGWPPTVGANAGWGQTKTEKWGWSLEPEPDGRNTSTPTSISGSFTVVLNDTDISGSPGTQPGAPCTKCPNCERSVNSTTDHLIGTCPLNGTADGCDQKVYKCTPEEEQLQKEWHKERTCNNWDVFTCGKKFRHCANGTCWFRFLYVWRGHSDDSVSEAPPGVTNKYPKSHFDEVPPDDNTPVTTPTDNTPNCASCTDGCSACPITGACGHTYTSSETNNHKWIYGSCSAGHAFYACQSYSHRSESWACGHTIYVCSPGVHVEERCSGINSNGQRCTYTFWRCQHPNVPSYGPSHVHAY